MGLLLLFNGGFMLIAALVSFLYQDGVTFEVLLAGSVTLGTGGVLMLLTKNHKKEIKKA
jgi:trk system potassium uptake protein TrkH